MLPRGVREHILSNQPRHLARLCELLRIPSVSTRRDTPDGCELAARWLAEYLGELGFSAKVAPTAGRPNVLASRDVSPSAPKLLIYGHYDVQPPDPLDQWLTDPFDPVVRDGWLFARGANDDKGQLFAQLLALEAWTRAGHLPLNVRVLLEGEEEIGSPNLEPFIVQHADELRADAVVISDSEFYAPGVPSITYALRGLAYFELTVRGPSADLHSGLHGGAAPNAAGVLARLLAALHDERGRVTLEGFYDAVRPLSDEERRQWALLPQDDEQYARTLGLDGAGALTGGEEGYSPLERRWARPTLDCNGIVGGYIGEGSKTIIPAAAKAKISCRLVSDQDPRQVERALRRHVERHIPAGMKWELQTFAGSRPVMLSRDSRAMRAAAQAYEEGFGASPVFTRCGASVPVTELFQRLLKMDAVLMGFGLPDDRLHSPNERFSLDQLWRGAITAASFMGLLPTGQPRSVRPGA